MAQDPNDTTENPTPPDWKPVLGLSDDPGEPSQWHARSGTVYDQPEPDPLIELTVIVPARNEEDCIAECLHSLIAQSEPGVFELDRDWELIVVDDSSTDRTPQVASSFSGVTVMKSGKLEPGWTG